MFFMVLSDLGRNAVLMCVQTESYLTVAASWRHICTTWAWGRFFVSLCPAQTDLRTHQNFLFPSVIFLQSLSFFPPVSVRFMKHIPEADTLKHFATVREFVSIQAHSFISVHCTCSHPASKIPLEF